MRTLLLALFLLFTLPAFAQSVCEESCMQEMKVQCIYYDSLKNKPKCLTEDALSEPCLIHCNQNEARYNQRLMGEQLMGTVAESMDIHPGIVPGEYPNRLLQALVWRNRCLGNCARRECVDGFEKRDLGRADMQAQCETGTMRRNCVLLCKGSLRGLPQMP